jgi:hypothetical protein
MQRYIEKLDEDARLREVYLQEMIRGSWWMREITWLLDDVGEPLRPVEIINRLTNRCRFESWKDKYDKRLELLKLIGIMVRQGRLERYNRVKVRIPAPRLARWWSEELAGRRPGVEVAISSCRA